jgi:hypothetical protein
MYSAMILCRDGKLCGTSGWMDVYRPVTWVTEETREEAERALLGKIDGKNVCAAWVARHNEHRFNVPELARQACPGIIV